MLIKRGAVSHISDAAALFQEHPPATSPASHAAVDKGVRAAASSGGTVPLPQQQRDVSVNGKGSESGRADVVINCTGLGSGKLGGVRDSAVYPARGQIVLVRNEAPFMACTSGTDDGEEEACYVMQRAAGTFLCPRSHPINLYFYAWEKRKTWGRGLDARDFLARSG